MVDPLGEAARRLRVVGRLEQGLGQQRERADRRLELVADVGHEVAAHPGHPVRLGDVGRLDRHVPGRIVRRRSTGPPAPARRAARRQWPAAATAGQVELDLAPRPAAADLAGQGPDHGVDLGRGPADAVRADQAEVDRGRVGQHRRVGRRRARGRRPAARPGRRRPPAAPAGAAGRSDLRFQPTAPTHSTPPMVGANVNQCTSCEVAETGPGRLMFIHRLVAVHRSSRPAVRPGVPSTAQPASTSRGSDMRTEFQADLDEVSGLLVAMADEVRAAMKRATTGLLSGDAGMCEGVVTGDAAVNELHREVEEKVYGAAGPPGTGRLRPAAGPHRPAHLGRPRAHGRPGQARGEDGAAPPPRPAPCRTSWCP